MHPFKAIGLKLISALLFAFMSALVRQLGDVAPVGQMVFFRSAFAILPVVLVYAVRGELATAVRTSRPLGQLGRGLLSVGGMFTNFSALTRLPLADATAISFSSPLITVALAAIILGVVLPLSVTGSPPHAWGRLRLVTGHAPGDRFTPTRVGKACPSA